MSAVSEIGRNLAAVLRDHIDFSDLDNCKCRNHCCCTKSASGAFILHPECPDHNSVPQPGANCLKHSYLRGVQSDD